MTIGLKEGDPVPEFVLESTDGPVSPGRFAGRMLVLYFYPKDDTPGCTTEAKDFSALAAEFAKAGASVVGISRDTVAKHQKFAAKHELGIILASDTDGSTCDAFGVWKEKNLYGRTYMGIERTTLLISPLKSVMRIWSPVRVKGHAEQVLEAVKAA